MTHSSSPAGVSSVGSSRLAGTPTPADASSPADWVLPRLRALVGSERLRVVALGGDGIGPEVVAAAVRCLEALALPIELSSPEHGRRAVERLGTAYPDATRAAVESADAVLFGAVDTGPEGHCRPILRHLRFGLDAYANVRPAVSLPGVDALTGDGRTNLVLVRELTEDMYPGCEGELAELVQRWPTLRDRVGRPVPKQGKFALRVITERASRRVGRYAAALAARRQKLGVSRGHVTIVGKANVLAETDGLFASACEAELALVPGITWSTLYVDEAARQLVRQPQAFDVVVTSNLFGDILSDVAAEAMGGMPMAPSGAIGEASAYFEPCHGSALDIVGAGVANPSATILSAAMLVAHLGFSEAAQRLCAAVSRTHAEGHRTPDAGGSLSTDEVAERVCRLLA